MEQTREIKQLQDGNKIVKPDAGTIRVKELSVDQLYTHTDPDAFSFETTADLEDLDRVIGQPRAVEALQFGVGIQAVGYNVFAMGPTGAGKRELVREFFEREASSRPVPHDWCYVNNFDESHKPKALRLPPGMGVQFREDMKDLVESLSTALSAAFESEEYQARRQSIASEFQEVQSKAFEAVQEQAQERGVALLRTPAGLAFAPQRDGEVMSPEEIGALSQEERDRLEKEVEELQGELQKIVRQVPGWQSDIQERLKELTQEMAQFAVAGLIDKLRAKYAEYPVIVEHLDAVQQDVVEHAENLMGGEQENPLQALMAAQGGGGAAGREEESPLLRRYQVNVLVDHSNAEGAPVVYEDNPTYQNLVGRVEHRAQLGALLTDFLLIKPGALQKANGGYLILDARKVLTQPYAWEGLKRVLQSDEIKIESIGQMLSMISTVSLEPEAVPLDVKVALFGEPMIYYMLYYLDPDFADLFKVEVDFAERIDRNPENTDLYARMIAGMTKRENLRPFDRTGVARVIEHAARMLGDAEKLSIQRRDIADVLREADYWAGQAGHPTVGAKDVDRAIQAGIYRSDRVRENTQESIKRQIKLIDTRGERVGQVNGLSVLQLGDFSFGQPSRITARTWLGKGSVVDIEREVEMGGPIHSKGVLILQGFLGERYAEDTPLALSASLVFEQSYAGVEGDSASSAELYALLSAIAEVPIKQSLAVTGSVNQHGMIQPIGGVNQKIEGFFDVCQEQGLTGEQGVLIPVSNVQHLMLRDDVREAVGRGEFHIYPVTTVDEGIELLTGVPAGEPGPEGKYPEGTINGQVEKRLTSLAEMSKKFSGNGASPREEEA
ncbi:MAG TPA: ATP-binding protein [Anaerolineae bacterium]|nr:ATP-binding protein [Anaerolineae bacterium]